MCALRLIEKSKSGDAMINVRTVVEDKDNNLRKRLRATWPGVIQAGLKALNRKVDFDRLFVLVNEIGDRHNMLEARTIVNQLRQ